jgi:hypothetical protein
MELASMLAGERFSDRPASVCPVIGSILRAYNDNIDDRRRVDLYRYAAEAVGTRGDFELQHRRAEIAIAWARAGYEARYRRRCRLVRRQVEPDSDWGPDGIAEYVVASLGRRGRDAAHAAMLWLLDRLIAMRGAGYEPAASVAALGGSDGSTRSSLAGRSGSHQFQRPNSETTAGTSSALITVASSRIPAASPVAKTLTSVSGPEAIDTNARNKISAALVTSLPVRPMPRTTAESVEPVASNSSRILASMKTS